LKIAVLMGGKSSEREVSLKTGKAVSKALRELGHEVIELDLTEDLPCKLLQIKPDKVFIALHGRPGEDGTVQGTLELMGIPYTGSDSIASALCIDKDLTKRVVSTLGVKTPRWKVFQRREDLEKLSWESFPAVVKPAREGSSVGLSVVNSLEEAKERIEELLRRSEKVLLEEFVKGRELTVGILKGKPLPVVEVKPKKGVYDYESKYTKGMSEYGFYEGERAEELQQVALNIYEFLSLRDFARIDFRMDEKGEIFFLEVNTVPGLTELSLLPMAAKKAGIDFLKLIDIIIS